MSERPVVEPGQRVIFAMGGGGFTMEPNNPLLDVFILTLSPRPTPRILFLPTAAGDPNAQINAFHERFADRACVPTSLSLFRLGGMTRSLAEIVAEQDIVYTGGGSMRNLLAIWRAHHLDAILVDAWQRGTVLAGLSAGAMCWFSGGISRSSGAPEVIAGLGLLPGSLTVHADGEPDRLPVCLEAIRAGELPGGWAADDGVGLSFRGERLERVVSSRPGASALRVDAVDGELVRARVTPELLGAESTSLLAPDEDVRELRRVHRFRQGSGGYR